MRSKETTYTRGVFVLLRPDAATLMIPGAHSLDTPSPNASSLATNTCVVGNNSSDAEMVMMLVVLPQSLSTPICSTDAAGDGGGGEGSDETLNKPNSLSTPRV